MIRYLIIFFALPIGLFWAWYGLSYFDINFGLLVFSRMFHDTYFELASQMTGLPPQEIPLYIARLCAIDLLLILALYAFRRRRDIRAWWQERRQDISAIAEPEAGPVPPAE